MILHKLKPVLEFNTTASPFDELEDEDPELEELELEVAEETGAALVEAVIPD